jgi:hypothetical protein
MLGNHHRFTLQNNQHGMFFTATSVEPDDFSSSGVDFCLFKDR